MALHQNRKSRDIEQLRGALLQVKLHAFNEQANCANYFKCPVASGKRTSSTYKDGLWLNVAGGEAAGIKLREALDKVFDDLTATKHMEASLHEYDTQVCEALIEWASLLNAS